MDCSLVTDQAFVTLATNDNYAKGAMVLGKSLRNHKTTKKLAVLIGPHVSEPFRYVSSFFAAEQFLSALFTVLLAVFLSRCPILTRLVMQA